MRGVALIEVAIWSLVTTGLIFSGSQIAEKVWLNGRLNTLCDNVAFEVPVVTAAYRDGTWIPDESSLTLGRAKVAENIVRRLRQTFPASEGFCVKVCSQSFSSRKCEDFKEKSREIIAAESLSTEHGNPGKVGMEFSIKLEIRGGLKLFLAQGGNLSCSRNFVPEVEGRL